MLSWLDKPKPRYERQLEEVKHAVMYETKLPEKELYRILEVLYEYRVID